MTFEKFIKRSELIFDHMQQIAHSMTAVSRFDAMTPINPLLRDVIAAQERLLTATEKLLEAATFMEEEEEMNVAG